MIGALFYLKGAPLEPLCGVSPPPHSAAFHGGKSEFFLGRDAAPNPHVTFERPKVNPFRGIAPGRLGKLFRAKKLPENAFLTLPAAGAKRSHKTIRYANAGTGVPQSANISYAQTFYRSLRAKLGNPL